MRDESGNWNETSIVQDGSYLVFGLSQTEATIALVQAEQNAVVVYVVFIGILAVAIAILYGCKRKKKRSKTEGTGHEVD